MITIFKWNNKWRIKIENETLEFDKLGNMNKILLKLLGIKREYEPYKEEEK